jgi:hypothetical protein
MIIMTLLLSSCSRKHLNEKIFTSKDITVSWYQISEITTMHDFVDITRWKHTRNIMEANTGLIHDIIISGDTIILKADDNSAIYSLSARALQCYIRLDTLE